MSKVVARSTKNRPLIDAVADLMENLGWQKIIKVDADVVIKLNLNTAEPDKVASANTSPGLVRAVCQVLQTRTKKIKLAEAHAYRNSAEECFATTDIYKIAQEVGAEIVNLSNAPVVSVGNQLLGPLPKVLLDADVFITMPVIKTHALTYFTGSLKNQWGCIPRYDRIALHYYLDDLLVELHKILHPQLSIMDGIIGVEGRGPTNGIPRRLDIILGSTDSVALDATAMRLIGLTPTKCSHIVKAYQNGLGKFHENDIIVDSDIKTNWAPFVEAHLDWAVDWMNRLTRFRWYRKYLLEVDWIFYPTKILINLLRKIGIVR